MRPAVYWKALALNIYIEHKINPNVENTVQRAVDRGPKSF